MKTAEEIYENLMERCIEHISNIEGKTISKIYHSKTYSHRMIFVFEGCSGLIDKDSKYIIINDGYFGNLLDNFDFLVGNRGLMRTELYEAGVLTKVENLVFTTLNEEQKENKKIKENLQRKELKKEKIKYLQEQLEEATDKKWGVQENES